METSGSTKKGRPVKYSKPEEARKARLQSQKKYRQKLKTRRKQKKLCLDSVDDFSNDSTVEVPNVSTPNALESETHAMEDETEHGSKEEMSLEDEEQRLIAYRLACAVDDVRDAWGGQPPWLWGAARYTRIYNQALQEVGTKEYAAYCESLGNEISELKVLHLRCEEIRIDVVRRQEEQKVDNKKEIIWADAICESVNRLIDNVKEELWCLTGPEEPEYYLESAMPPKKRQRPPVVLGEEDNSQSPPLQKRKYNRKKTSAGGTRSSARLAGHVPDEAIKTTLTTRNQDATLMPIHLTTNSPFNEPDPIVKEPTTIVGYSALGPARRPDGSFKDASELDLPFSADETTPVKIKKLLGDKNKIRTEANEPTTIVDYSALGPARRPDGSFKDASELDLPFLADETTPVKIKKLLEDKNKIRTEANEPTTIVDYSALGPARRPDGSFKDASELDLPFSADETTPVKIKKLLGDKNKIRTEANELATIVDYSALGPARRPDGSFRDASELDLPFSADETTPATLKQRRNATPGPSWIQNTDEYDGDREREAERHSGGSDSGSDRSEYAPRKTTAQERKLHLAKLAGVSPSETDEDLTDYDEYIKNAVTSSDDERPRKSQPAKKDSKLHFEVSDEEELSSNENQCRSHKTGPMTKQELKVIAELDQQHQKQYQELAHTFNRPVSSVLAHITGGHKFSRRRNAHNARQQVHSYLRKFEGVRNPALERARGVLNDYDNLPSDKEEQKKKKEELDTEIREIAEGLEAGLYDGYVKEGNVYKVMEKFKQDIRRQIHWYSKNFNIKSVFALWPGPGITDFKSSSKSSIVSCNETIERVFLDGAPHVQQALQTLKIFADYTELTQGDTVAPSQSKGKATKGKGKDNAENTKGDAGGSTRDATRKALTDHLKDELRKHEVSFSDKVQWGTLANTLYKHRLCLCNWNSRHYRGFNGGKPEYFGINGITIKKLTASQLKDIQKALDADEGPYITKWEEKYDDLSLMQIAQAPLLMSRDGGTLISVIECNQYLEEVRASKKQGKKKAMDVGDGCLVIDNASPIQQFPESMMDDDGVNDIRRWVEHSNEPSHSGGPAVDTSTLSSGSVELEHASKPASKCLSSKPASHCAPQSVVLEQGGSPPSSFHIRTPSTSVSVQPRKEVSKPPKPKPMSRPLPSTTESYYQQPVQNSYQTFPPMPLFTGDGRPFYFPYPGQMTGQFPPQMNGQFPLQMTGQYPPHMAQFPPQMTAQFPPQMTGQQAPLDYNHPMPPNSAP